ncbi:MAG TPA: hypothetical protein VLA99_04210 [Nitrospiraceae bacterium]|nr:hypothetical protein [Nitrospiraceae bacterium]
MKSLACTVYAGVYDSVVMAQSVDKAQMALGRKRMKQFINGDSATA